MVGTVTGAATICSARADTVLLVVRNILLVGSEVVKERT